MTTANMEYRHELSPDVRVIDLERPRLWTSLPAFRRYLLREKPDAIISALGLANGIAVWATRLVAPRPVLVLTEHHAYSMALGYVRVPRYRPLMWVIRSSYRFADAIVGVSRGVAERLRCMPGVADENVHVIYNPAWSPEILEQAREQPSHPWFFENVPIIIAIGRLSASKDFPTLFKAFAKIRMRRQARLVLLGEGSLRPELESLARKLSIAEDMWMPGFVQNPFAYMARAQVFALSSVGEGLPTVLIEAMACGIPVVSTDCPSGPAEILDDGRYGPLVPVGDADALAIAIERQLDQPTPAEVLRARAREFSVDSSGDAYIRLITKLCPGVTAVSREI